MNYCATIVWKNSTVLVIDGKEDTVCVITWIDSTTWDKDDIHIDGRTRIQETQFCSVRQRLTKLRDINSTVRIHLRHLRVQSENLSFNVRYRPASSGMLSGESIQMTHFSILIQRG